MPLAPVTDPELVPGTIAVNLSARGDVAQHIDEKRMLILLDNLEQVLDVAPQLSQLLRACPNLHLLLTSRALLRIDPEREYRVEPLPAGDAVALFRERAAISEPEDAVAEICQRLDCLPLAVELAAARTTLLAPVALLARLEQRLPLLTVGRRDAPERHRTLRATIEWSHDLLEETEKEVLHRLAVFAGSFEAEAAEEVARAELDTLQSLVDKSLVRRWASGRLGMLETIHEYSAERLEASGEAHELRRRHAKWMLTLAESANLSQVARGPERHELVQAEGENVRAALAFALDHDRELGVRLVVSLEHFFMAGNPFEGARWVRLLLERDGTLPDALLAPALRVWSGATFIVGRFEEGTALAERSLAAYRRVEDELGTGLLLERLARSALQRGDPTRARELAEESGELLRRAGFRKGELLSLDALGEVEFAEGNHDRGLELIRQSIDLSIEIGWDWKMCHSLESLAEKAVELARWDDAEGWAREAVVRGRGIDDRQVLVYGLALLARVAAQTGRPERAGTLWGAVEADELRGEIGQWEEEREDYAAAVLAAGDTCFERGRSDGRRLTLDEAVEYALADAGTVRKRGPRCQAKQRE